MASWISGCCSKKTGSLVLNSPLLVRDAAPRSQGPAQLASGAWRVAEDLVAGRLQQVLADWVTPRPNLHLYYWAQRHSPPDLQALLAQIQEERRAVAIT